MSGLGTLALRSIAQTPAHFQAGQVMSRQAAIGRLQTLVPGTQEYDQLQAALIKKIGIVTIDTLSTSYSVHTTSQDDVLLGGFGASEHIAIGQQIKLKGLPENSPLLVKGIAHVLFQHIVALAGDFYGIVGAPISLPGGTQQEKTERFRNAFNTLFLADNNEIRKILVELDDEYHAVQHSSLPHHCYSSQMMERNKAIKKIKDDIEELLIDNSDHFFNNAKDAYHVGHALAIETAREAGQNKDIEKLKLAYAIEAFACHFLTDLFASGHIRNQRGDLELFLINQLKFSPNVAKKLAGLLTGAQHEKDGHEGLNVSNSNGDQWRAYGDGSFFEGKNAENRRHVVAATQRSVDEVYQAYENPDSLTETTMNHFIPNATTFNPLPLYTVEEEGKALFIYEEGRKVKIENTIDCRKCISLALKYLPENYVSGFITPHFEIPPILNKLVFPQVQRLTGSVWAIAGVASYRQINQFKEQQDQKMEEIAGEIKATYENTVRILERMDSIDAQLKHQPWQNVYQEIRGPISAIKDVLFEQSQYQGLLPKDQLLKRASELWRAHITISRVFCDKGSEGGKLLLAYAEMIRPTTDPSEIKMNLTLWFREVLDYQVQAFRLYGILQLIEGELPEDQIKAQVLKFESSIVEQININSAHIDEVLIYERLSYISLQVQKSKVVRESIKRLKQSN